MKTTKAKERMSATPKAILPFLFSAAIDTEVLPSRASSRGMIFDLLGSLKLCLFLVKSVIYKLKRKYIENSSVSQETTHENYSDLFWSKIDDEGFVIPTTQNLTCWMLLPWYYHTTGQNMLDPTKM